MSAPDYSIIHLPPESAEWTGLLAQFTLAVAAREGRGFAAWAAERFTRASSRGHGVAALADGHLLGVLFFELSEGSVELMFPWLAAPHAALAHDLVLAARQVAASLWPDEHDLRVERQLLPETPEIAPLEAAGFSCHWRKRMQLELDAWMAPLRLPHGYRLGPWNIRELDAAARVVFEANAGTLDARLYASFFGTSPADCRQGLLAILAGRYGPLAPQATLCAFAGQALAGINLVIRNDAELASIIEISVAPAHQRQGLGRALMIASQRVLKEERVARVELAVTVENTRALALYRSLGYCDIGQFAVCVL